MQTTTPFTPPPDSAINVRDLPRDVLVEIASTSITGVVYRIRIDTSLKVYVWHSGQWNFCERLDCTPHEDSLQLIADHFAGQLVKWRRIEQNWRGEVTPERIARDHDVARRMNRVLAIIERDGDIESRSGVIAALYGTATIRAAGIGSVTDLDTRAREVAMAALAVALLES